jgi:hypothetical protein
MEGMMPKRAVGRRGWSWAWAVCAAASVWACSSGGSSEPGESAPGSDPSSASSDVTPADVAPGETRDVRGADGLVDYQLVETADGISMEAVTPTQVQTVSCPSRSCRGICDECAVRACAAAGELGEACERLARECNDTCTCDGAGLNNNCGFPVCALNRNLCYVDPNQPLSPPPDDPAPGPGDPSPISNPSGPSNAGTPAPNGSGAANPGG